MDLWCSTILHLVLRLIVVKTICERSQSAQILKRDRRSGGFRKEKRKRGGTKKDNPKMGNGRTKKSRIEKKRKKRRVRGKMITISSSLSRTRLPPAGWHVLRLPNARRINIASNSFFTRLIFFDFSLFLFCLFFFSFFFSSFFPKLFFFSFFFSFYSFLLSFFPFFLPSFFFSSPFRLFAISTFIQQKFSFAINLFIGRRRPPNSRRPPVRDSKKQRRPKIEKIRRRLTRK